MRRSDYSSRVSWFTLVVVLGVIALSVLPPFELFGMLTSRVDVLSELRDEKVVQDEPVEYVADIERLEMELATLTIVDSVEVNDSLVEPAPIRYEWIEEREKYAERAPLRSTDLENFRDTQIVAIEDFDSLEHTSFDTFIDKLIAGDDVRIAFMGDSFVEGDILTSDLRSELQKHFGGRGVGFVACDIPFKTVRKSVKRSSSGWTAYSVMKPKGAPEYIKDKFYVSGYIAEGKVGATTRWESTDIFPTLDSCTRARIVLFSRDTSRVVVELNDSISHEFEVAGADYLRELYIEAPIDALRLRVVDGSVICYGASLEGDRGVIVDNFSVRSNNGHAIFGTSATINRQADEMLGYDLVVLQYGLNIMQKGQRGYSRYRDQLCDMVAYAKRCFPNAAIMIMGVSDRWIKNEESGKYEPIGSVDALTSYQRAAADSCGVTFWNTSMVMERLGGMPKFVANGWAAKDYTHINYVGGRNIANALVETICTHVYDELVEREAEAERIAELKRLQELELQRYLHTKLEVVKPIIDSVDFSEIMGYGDSENEEE